jgi:hypothetical protein
MPLGLWNLIPAAGFCLRLAGGPGSIQARRLRRLHMTPTKIILALALVLGTTSIALAQSQRNFGPGGPSRFDCFGEPYSGTVASRCPGEGGYGYYRHHWHHYR